MFYICLFLALFGLFSLVSTITVLKKYKKQYGKELEEYLDGIK